MQWFIPGNVPSSKNGRRWTGKHFIASKSVMNYRKKTKEYYKKYAQEFRDATLNLNSPIHVEFTFIRGSKHKFDFINPAQTVQDDMVKHEWIEDDNADLLLPVFTNFKYDKDNPGVIIRILYGETALAR
jgi:Holliday junction resolvase RusA-like endonuclease